MSTKETYKELRVAERSPVCSTRERGRRFYPVLRAWLRSEASSSTILSFSGMVELVQANSWEIFADVDHRPQASVALPTPYPTISFNRQNAFAIRICFGDLHWSAS